jgi:hypothetical protein
MNHNTIPMASDFFNGLLVLTGNGRSIQALRKRLRTDYFGDIDYQVKAYWAPGKTGLE